MSGQISKKEQRRILKQLGINIPQKKTIDDISNNIEEGKNKHRMFVQEMKNREIMKNVNRDGVKLELDSFKNWNQESPEYTSFKSFMIKSNWDELSETEE